MKRTLLFLAAVAFFASCSSPKYSYNFDHYNYKSGKKMTTAINDVAADEGLLAIQDELLLASTKDEVSLMEMTSPIIEKTSTPQKKAYSQMTNVERKALRTYLKAEVKNSIKSRKAGIESVSSTKGMDNDLKLASVFGAVGIVGILLGSVSQVFLIIGGIALLIGVIFFVMWLLKQ
ncbi:MAG: hypothetical protein AABY93_15165 [Bacteroidota bacterium]